MEVYAKAFFELNQPAAKGSKVTKRESLEQVQKNKRKKIPGYNHPDLTLPELPKEVGYIWRWYAQELQNGDLLTWQEIKAWADVCGLQILDIEAKALRKLSYLHKTAIQQTAP